MAILELVAAENKSVNILLTKGKIPAIVSKDEEALLQQPFPRI